MSGDRARDAPVWLGFAIGDLEAARSQPGRHVRPRIVAFHSQQAAEKALVAGRCGATTCWQDAHALADVLAD